MSYYEVLLFLHIGAAAAWLGGALLFFVLFQRAKLARDPVLAERLGAHVEWMAKRFFVPASLSVLVLGILLTIEGPWSLGDLWIVLGLVGMAATFVLGIGVIEPAAKKMQAAIAAHGPEHPEVAGYGRRLDALGIVDLTLLSLLVWVIVFKPSTGELGTLVVPAAALVAAALVAARAYRSRAPEPAPRTTSGRGKPRPYFRRSPSIRRDASSIPTIPSVSR
jgi:uncharacterized membrane protein